MTVLKPCPFCGGDDIEFDHNNYLTWYIICECGVEINGCRSREHAFERWNTRSPGFQARRAKGSHLTNEKQKQTHSELSQQNQQCSKTQSTMGETALIGLMIGMAMGASLAALWLLIAFVGSRG